MKNQTSPFTFAGISAALGYAGLAKAEETQKDGDEPCPIQSTLSGSNGAGQFDPESAPSSFFDRLEQEDDSLNDSFFERLADTDDALAPEHKQEEDIHI